MSARTSEPATFDAIVVGAGVGGLRAIHRLRKLDLKVRAFEAGGGVGGTWYWNRPGMSLRRRKPGVLLFLLGRVAAGVALARALRHATRDPALHRPCGRSFRPQTRHRVQYPG